MQLVPRPPGSRCASSTAAILAFIYIPIGIIVLYSFNESRVATWPISGLTLDWYRQALADPGIRNALSALGRGRDRRDDVALMLGTLHRARRPALPVLRARDDLVPRHPPDRAPGDRHRHRAQHGVPRGRHRARHVHDHRRPRDVLHRHDLQQRHRAPPADLAPTFEEASGDLGADTFRTFRRITLPAIRTSLVAGALLAFALSFDEIIVTNFTAGRGRPDAADLDLQQLLAAEPAAARERGRGPGPRALDHPGLPRDPDHPWRGRDPQPDASRRAPSQPGLPADRAVHDETHRERRGREQGEPGGGNAGAPDEREHRVRPPPGQEAGHWSAGTIPSEECPIECGPAVWRGPLIRHLPGT